MTDVLSLFLWEIKGTSLDQLKLDCGGVGTINRTDHVTNGSTTVTLMLTLVDEDHVTCNVTDGGVVLDTRTIDRVQGRSLMSITILRLKVDQKALN